MFNQEADRKPAFSASVRSYLVLLKYARLAGASTDVLIDDKLNRPRPVHGANMNNRRGVVFQFLVILFLAAKTVGACQCPAADNTVLGKFEDARFVVIARVLAVEKLPELDTTHARIVVEKVYKGNLRVGQEMIFGEGERASCVEDFDEREIGAKFLFYLKPKEKTPTVWYADRCGNSIPLPGFDTHHVNDAADDLSYLEKMNKVTGKTRISGTLISYQWSPIGDRTDFKKVAATKVRLIGEEKTYETVTNEDGVYEIYDLPPGRYTVEPKTPKGWAIENPSAYGGGGSSSREDTKHFQLTLKKGRHAYFDFFFIVDTRLRGRVLNPLGSPMRGVCVNLIPTEGKVSEFFKRIDCTQSEGTFEIEEIPFGSYFIVVNADDKITANQPFRRFYYPNVYEREKAQVVTIVEGDAKAIDVHVPEVREVVDLEGFFVSADRKPVTRAAISFKAEKTDELTDGDAFTRTDENGRFSLRVLKGLKGKLAGEVWLDGNEFRECPQIVVLLKAKGEVGWLEHKTDEVEIQIQGNVDNMELKLPFASCKDGKIVSRIKID